MKEIYGYGRGYADIIKNQEYELTHQEKILSAKDMFEKLGYEQVKNNHEEISYQKEKYINKYSNTCSMYTHINFELDTKRVFATDYITLGELQAINQQMKEIGVEK